MPEDVAGVVERVRRHYDDFCFACGRDNPVGLHLDDFTLEQGRVRARFVPRAHFRGAGSSLHGGVAATALDEVLVWAGLLSESVLTVTGTMQLRFRRPVEVEEPIDVSGWVDQRNGRRLRISGELSVAGETRVEASGLYLVVSTLDELLTGHRSEV